MSNNFIYLGLDFDGSVVTHEFPKIGKPVPGALEWLLKFQEMGIKIVLNTMRSDCGVRPPELQNCLTDAVDYLKSNGIKLYGINHNPDQDSWTGSPKVFATLYVDDAAVGCPLVYPDNGDRPYIDWAKLGPEVLNRLGMGYSPR